MAESCCSIRPIQSPQPIIRCSRSGAWSGKSATSRTSPTSWSIPKARSTSGTIGRRPSHSLLVGAIPHVLYAEADKTLAGVAAFLSDPKRPIEATLKAMMTTSHLGEQGAHPVVASTARELLNKSENERSGVLSSAMSFLGLYRDPVVAQVTRRCDWRIADLTADVRPTTLYLVVPPSDISRTKPLIRLVLNQIGRRLTEDLHARDRRHRVLMMLDEFLALVSRTRRSQASISLWRSLPRCCGSLKSKTAGGRRPSAACHCTKCFTRSAICTSRFSHLCRAGPRPPSAET